MRQDRWSLFQIFVFVSLLIHGVALYTSRSLPRSGSAGHATEMEVTLQPLPVPVASVPVPIVAKKQPVVEKRTPSLGNATKTASVVNKPVVHKAASSVRTAKSNQSDDLTPVRTIRAPAEPTLRTPAKQPTAELNNLSKIQDEKPAPLGLPSASSTNSTPQIARLPHNADPVGGASPPAAARTSNSTPERRSAAADTPPGNITLENGSTHRADSKPLTGVSQSGGVSVLGVDNPLAKDAQPNDRPGIGPGRSSSSGVTSAGSGTGAGNLSSLRNRGSSGSIGRGTGSQSGGNGPPGKSSSSVAELPGGIASGRGYGKGRGTGNSTGAGSGSISGSGTETTRGVPFGDITGLLGTGGKGNSGSGSGSAVGGTSAGRGSVFGAKGGNLKGALNVVYVLDCSGSMRDGNKIGKAKEALKRAISELRPTDTFNVLAFNSGVYPLSPGIMLHATQEIVDAAMLWIDRLGLNNHTNISGAMAAALKMEPVNLVYLMSDGEPEGRETLHDPDEIRAFVKERNTQNARVMTLALCLGEKYPGERIMRGLAEDGNGTYNYIDLRKVR